MAVPVKAVVGTVKKVTPVLAVVVATAGGFVLGALSRQPEINDLKGQVKRLKKQQEHLIQVLNLQNEEIEDLLARYHMLKTYQVLQRSEMKTQLRESLIFQYATVDYLNLMLSCIEANANPSEVEADFYCAFTKVLSDKDLSDEEMAAVKVYVISRHKSEIKSMVPCDTDTPLEAILRYGESGKSGFKVPKIDFPDIGIPGFEKKGRDDS